MSAFPRRGHFGCTSGNRGNTVRANYYATCILRPQKGAANYGVFVSNNGQRTKSELGSKNVFLFWRSSPVFRLFPPAHERAERAGRVQGALCLPRGRFAGRHRNARARLVSRNDVSQTNAIRYFLSKNRFRP